ncbi:hypothetical protein GYMLUDRAFT_251916 [Collybiopsis luxurians FD-317 M1]|uniref:ABM domain-containing protein n=1 Tax=Collybiopsis luxurians FD-317 M1 TaxID=944289 RepID=A0A0D0C9Y4_9AGAR|nr:hypothetical protein GYMLUDRAFT_251916 [Collybiopsis luxurians FD-317 M1]
MASIISYITFPASETFTKSSEQTKTAIESITARADGLTTSYHGIQTEDEGSKYGYLVSTWESLDKLNAFRNSESGAKLNSLLATLTTGEVKRHQLTPFRRTPEPAFQCRTTEFVVGTLRDGVQFDSFKEAVTKAADTLQAGNHPSAILQDVNDQRILMLVGGWDNAADHWEFFKAETTAPLLTKVQSVAQLDISHAYLQKHSAYTASKL